MRKFFIPVFLILTFSLQGQDKSDSLAIVKLLVDDYDTMEKWDIERHKKNCTSNYRLIENAEIWDMVKEAEYYTENSTRKIKRTDQFDFTTITVYGNIAYAIYNLKSEFLENGKSHTLQWTESSIFRKVNGEWKIELIHSTPVTQK